MTVKVKLIGVEAHRDDASVGKVIAVRAWEPKSGFPAPMQKIGPAEWVWSTSAGV